MKIILPLLDDVNLVNDCHDLLPLESLRSKQLLEVIISEETFGGCIANTFFARLSQFEDLILIIVFIDC